MQNQLASVMQNLFFLLSDLMFNRRYQHPASKINGGARRDRTDDLLLAKQALSQLSYGPLFRPNKQVGGS